MKNPDCNCVRCTKCGLFKEVCSPCWKKLTKTKRLGEKSIIKRAVCMCGVCV